MHPLAAGARVAALSLAAALILVGCALEAPDPAARNDGEAGIEDAFARVCEPAVLGGYALTRLRNGAGQPLTSSQRRALRPIFGGYVDRARVHWDASLITRWRVLGRDLELGSTKAMAFGHEIFVAQNHRPYDDRQLALLAHELAHTWQATRLGGVRAFADEYCRAYFRAGFSYTDNAFEVEAREVQSRARACLDGGPCDRPRPLRAGATRQLSSKSTAK